MLGISELLGQVGYRCSNWLTNHADASESRDLASISNRLFLSIIEVDRNRQNGICHLFLEVRLRNFFHPTNHHSVDLLWIETLTIQVNALRLYGIILILNLLVNFILQYATILLRQTNDLFNSVY